ncbi:MAG TPA: sigma-70 family RNA polymerase sigma factor [Polyangiaceae bacterium]|nr:sigma-70 family RNA polymerase sigma factor [Polyangiaceae bacterium]
MALRPASEKAETARFEDVQAVRFLGDDAALVAGVRAGNAVAMAAFYDRYVADVRRILLHTLGPRLDLADLVQDVFINVLTSVRSLREAAALRSWLFQVTVRTARKHLRSRSRRWWLKLWPEGDELETQPAVALEESASDAVQATFRILKDMAAEDRLVFSLRYVSGLDLSEMAEACEMSLSTLKRRLNRAEQRFHAAAQEDEALCGFAARGET